MLAFNERFDILQGLDRPTNPSDPPERKQRLDWELTADIVAGNRRPIRVSAPSPEWIVAHRGTARFREAADPRSAEPSSMSASGHVDPQWLRFEVVAASQPACGMGSPNPRRMRVLSHEPFDPEAPDASIKRWPARTQVRVNLRPESAPFIDRPGFEEADRTALTMSGSAWQVTDGRLVTPRTRRSSWPPSVTPAGRISRPRPELRPSKPARAWHWPSMDRMRWSAGSTSSRMSSGSRAE